MIRNFKFWLGFSIIAGLIIASFVHEIFFDSQIRQITNLYDDSGTLVDSAPVEPSFKFPLGTDMAGYDISLKVLQGAKYTLLSVIIIGFLRVIAGLIVAIPIAFYLPEKVRNGLEQLLNSFYFIPLTIISVFILSPVLIEQLKLPEKKEYFLYSFTERVGIEIFILTILVVPLLSSLIGNLLISTLQEDFIEGAKVLGASRWRVFRKHVMPHLLPKLVIVWCQQCVQVLIIFAHLGYFKLFFGGTDIDYNPMMADPPTSISNEWSGLVGDYYNLIMAKPFIALGPIMMFAIGIYAFQLMGEGFGQHLQTRYLHIKQVRKKNAAVESKKKARNIKMKFSFLQNKGA
ncbi:ABC transporter permease [Fictibacillus barbaricus]|uniref:Peptide/nickel transport system permease protein n=1 Tax=Fictibacillus barbaricus TaxID=182136 RepID=A0ABU1U0Q1_9BACL|nr:ABC transporter permease subunit [Fictibacillus barbaricus]MDR7072976.1 peptide/nickel transport system permease protein [Fictibacillus barbaricus]